MEKPTKLENLTAEALSVLPKELTESLPLQKIEIVSVIKKVNRTDKRPDGQVKKDWQGYLVKFIDSNIVMPVSGGLILTAGEENFKITKSKDKKEYELIAQEMGYDMASRRFFTKPI
jgi:hypothetical protein